jgi:hypothetical protein
MGAALIVALIVILVAIVARLAAGGLDRQRVQQHIAERGGKVLEVTWSPLGPGWFGERSDRIYAVRYLDGDGNEHRAYCKTSMFTGVYFAQDGIVTRGAMQPDSKARLLEEENQRLREELARSKSDGE